MPLLLILDLDETLIYATETPLEREPDFVVGDFFHVYERPGLADFVRSVSADFMVAVWTSASDSYAAAIVRHVFPDPGQLQFVWTRKRCTYRLDIVTGEAVGVKNLEKVRRRGFALESVLIVDDRPNVRTIDKRGWRRDVDPLRPRPPGR